MEKKEFRHVTVRLSYNSPEHMKIMGILDDLNLAVHKSKNQFIINAINCYVAMLESDDLTKTAVQEAEKVHYVTDHDLEAELSKMKSAVRIEIYEDVIRLFGCNLLASKVDIPEPVKAVQNERIDTVEQEGTALMDVSDTLSQFDNVMQHVMDWSDGE